MFQIQYQKLDETAFDLVENMEDDLGYDLRTPKDFTIPAKGSVVLDTRVAVKVDQRLEIMRGHFDGNQWRVLIGCFVKSKSGISTVHSVEHGAGVIDVGYTGPLIIKLYNHGDVDVHFVRGNKIAQVTFPLIFKGVVTEVASLESSDGRGEAGFGSTGT